MSVSSCYFWFGLIPVFAGSDNTKSHLVLFERRNLKVLEKHQHVTSKHNTDQSKTQNTMDNFPFKTKTNYSMLQANCANTKKKKKMAGQDEFLPSGTLKNKKLLFMVNPPFDDHDCFTNNSDAYIRENSSLSLKPSSEQSLLFNQFNNSSPRPKTDPENVVNSNYYNIDQLQTLKFPDKKQIVILIPHKSLFIK